MPPSEEWQTRKKLDQWKRYMRLASELTQLTIAELWWLCPKCLWPVLIGARDAYKAFRALRDDEDPWWERRWY